MKHRSNHEVVKNTSVAIRTGGSVSEQPSAIKCLQTRSQRGAIRLCICIAITAVFKMLHK